MNKSLPHDAYEALADDYNAMIETKPHNAYYDRPAVQSLVPGVSGKAILDAGCGSGVYAAWLINKGAMVTAIDASEKMLSHAKNRLGNKAELILANMEEPLSFLQNESFDGVLSSLAIAYVHDHYALFKEFSRVLKTNGWFIFSTDHPFFNYEFFKLDNYFETTLIEYTWKGFGKLVNMPSYYHSLGSLTGALNDSGFVIEKILEPKPTEDFKINDERNYNELMKFPSFICMKARKISYVPEE